MKILLLNAHSPANAGDLAILQETLACLWTAFPEAKLTVAINDTTAENLPAGAVYVASLTRWLIRVDADGTRTWRKSLAVPYALWLVAASLIFRWSRLRLLPHSSERRRLMQAYYDADLVVVIGGGHLYARHAANIAFGWLWLGLAMAVLMCKPLVLLPQSFGPLPGTIQRHLLRWLLARSAFIAAREYRSLQLLAAIGLRRQVLVLPDMAFTTTEASSQALVDALPRFADLCASGQPVVGMTLIDWQAQNPGFHGQQEYEQACLALIRHVQRCYEARVVLFAQCTGPTAAEDDRRIARRLATAALAEGLPLVEVIDASLSPGLLKAAYARLDILVATRMHSAIFALSTNVPTLVIGYLHKSAGIMEMLGLERYVLPIDHSDTAQLCSRFDALWAARDSIRHHLGQRVPAMQATLRHVPALLRLTEWNT